MRHNAFLLLIGIVMVLAITFRDVYFTILSNIIEPNSTCFQNFWRCPHTDQAYVSIYFALTAGGFAALILSLSSATQSRIQAIRFIYKYYKSEFAADHEIRSRWVTSAHRLQNLSLFLYSLFELLTALNRDPLSYIRMLTEWQIFKGMVRHNGGDVRKLKFDDFRKRHDSFNKNSSDLNYKSHIDNAPIFEITSLSWLDDKILKRRIKAYFHTLDDLFPTRSDTHSFLSFVTIADGYLAPALLVAGLMSRYEEDWQEIISLYHKDAIWHYEKGAGAAVPLNAGYRVFQFYCWLLWGPSIPICNCQSWRPKDENRNTLFMQYGFGDEANSVIVRIDNQSKIRRLRERWQSAKDDGKVIGAFPDRIIGKFTTPLGVNVDHFPKIIYEHHARSSGIYLDYVQSEPQSDEAHAYYSAYVWIMFLFAESEGEMRRLHEEKQQISHRNLLPIFEHGNVGMAETFRIHKGLLATKAVAVLDTLTSENPGMVIEYVCASDHSGGCMRPGHEDSLASAVEPFLPALGTDRLVDLLRAELDRTGRLDARQRAQLTLPGDEAEHRHGRLTSCDLPAILDRMGAGEARQGDAQKQSL
jgi:hypothetical protein